MSEEIKLIREEIIIQQKEIEELQNRLAVRGDIIKIFKKEIEQKDKVINKMAESMTISEEVGVEKVKEYFYNEVNKDE